MRWVVVLLLVATAGCLTAPQAPAEAALTAFVAVYDLTARDGDGQNIAQGPLTLTLHGKPEPTLAGDLTLQLAYRLDVQLRLEWPGGHVSDFDGVAGLTNWTATYFLDPLAIAATRGVCLQFWQLCRHHPDGEVGGQMTWAQQGAPWPLGIGWPHDTREPVRFIVDGGQREAVLERQDTGWRLPNETAFPSDVFLDPGASYVYDGKPAPAHVLFRMFPADYAWQYEANRTSFTPAGQLEPIDPWPKATWAPSASPPKFFAGDDEEAFSMGITFQEAYAELARQVPDANISIDGKCIRILDVYWGGGARVNEPLAPLNALLADDNIAFQLYGPNAQGMARGWQVRYHAQGPPVVSEITGSTGYGQAETQSEGQEARCDRTVMGDGYSASDFLLEGWALPTPHSGVPCGLTVASRSLRDAAHEFVGGHSFIARLVYQAEDNDPWPDDPDVAGWTGFFVRLNPETGLWEDLYLEENDLAAIARGEGLQHPRPLPPSSVDARTAYRCIEVPNEGPL